MQPLKAFPFGEIAFNVVEAIGPNIKIYPEDLVLLAFHCAPLQSSASHHYNNETFFGQTRKSGRLSMLLPLN
jgi:hypothetical protein